MHFFFSSARFYKFVRQQPSPETSNRNRQKTAKPVCPPKSCVLDVLEYIYVYIYVCMYIYIYISLSLSPPRRTLEHFFLPSAPRQLHRHFHPEVCKTRQNYNIDLGIFISRCFVCSDIILCLGIFTPKLGGKTRNLGGKKRNLAEFCSKHFSALNNMTRPYEKLSASAFFAYAFFLGIGRNKRLQAG